MAVLRADRAIPDRVVRHRLDGETALRYLLVGLFGSFLYLFVLYPMAKVLWRSLLDNEGGFIGAANYVRHKRTRARRGEWTVPDNKEHLRLRPARDAALHSVDSLPQFPHQPARFSFPAQHLAEVFDRAESFVDGLSRNPINRDAQAFKLVRRLDSVGLPAAQNQIGFEGHNPFQIRIQRGSDVRLQARLGGIFAVVRVTHHLVAQSQSEEGFGNARRE